MLFLNKTADKRDFHPQPGVLVAFQIVFYVTNVEANKTKKMSARVTRVNYDLGMKILSDHTSESLNSHLRKASAILLRHVSFWGDDPVEIFIFYQDTSAFRANLIFPTKPSTLNISALFAISGLFITKK